MGDFKLVPDFKDRAAKMDEEVTKRLMKTPSNKELLGMQKALAVLKGKLTVQEAMFRWDKL